MAYQPKSYRKFVATAATATLVAGVLAPAVSAASFTDVPERYQDAVDFVVSKGIQGFSDTQFGTGENIKRVDAAVMVAKVVGLDTESAPAAGFTDVPARAQGAVNALKAAGITSGKSTTSFGAQDLITRGELAIWIDRAFNLEGSADHNFTDVADRYAEAVEALVANEITNGVSATSFGVTQNAKRGDFAIFLHRASNVDAELEVVEVSAINAKTIEVDFNTAVEDTSKASVELLRGAFKQNATINWSEDKKSVQLVGASNFQAADYTVNISGLTEKTLTGSVKIEAQKVASIEILDEVAVVSASNSAGALPDGATATVGYQVKDQYGTDISDNISLTTNDSKTVGASKGVVTLSGLNGKKVGDIVPVVLIDTATGTSASKTVKLSAESTVSSIEVAGIYNAKGEEVALNDASKASEAFIVLNLKDQYGKEITDAAKASGLVITNTNPTNLTVANAVEKVKIGDKDKLVIKIADIKKAGSTDVLLISTTNGQSAKYTVNVAETATSDAISVSQPEIAVAGEETLIPVTVTDKSGNVITDKKLLSNPTKGIKVGSNPVAEDKLVVKDGQVFYKATLAEGTQALVFQSSTYKVATVTISVKAAAVPTLVRGLEKPLVLSTVKGDVTVTAKDHLVIEDQYGRVIKDSAAPVKVELVGESDVVNVLAGNVVSPEKNGTATLKISLVTEKDNVNSAVEVKVQVTDGTQYSDYEVAEIGLTKAGSEKSITVNGLLNGGKVALDDSEYTATVTGGKGNVTVTDGKFTVAETSLNTTDGKPVDTEFTLKVTVEATGKVYEQKFVVSNKDKAVQDFFFTAAETTDKYADAKAITEATLASGSAIATSLKSGEDTVNVATVDQYGNKVVAAISADTVTVVPEKAGEVKITGNGTATPTVELRDGVKESVVTLKIKVGSATKDLKVKVVTPQ
ncbi:S-layer homology domain-containing protein [Cytobacillus gottheilii]|uniref:S-layer homology domain-containing protein n=1 Tax=Cytobacillus gottheilii TaxID=859144 RepID=UPI0008358458|nr:S-layer homology domain-containing protein [Cytobacillus gottheilii]